MGVSIGAHVTTQESVASPYYPHAPQKFPFPDHKVLNMLYRGQMDELMGHILIHSNVLFSMGL